MHSHNDFVNKKQKIIIIGLGYVGLPLACIMNRKYAVVGFDVNGHRISELTDNTDKNGEISSEELRSLSIEYTSNPEKISDSGLIIVTVPTPINPDHTPDLTPVISASKTAGKYMKAGSVVVYESTVYPGVTEEICVPILERESGLKWKKDFNVGYSPERINPGDKVNTIDKIKKIVSGDSKESAQLIEAIYNEVINPGVHVAPTIKTAEAAKVIENTQRDLSIALMNELSMIFNRLKINTQDVLKAAGTKWNFQKFFPGLVGGHCIGVDPYYLTFKAESVGYHPQIILAGRRINDSMGKYIAEITVKKLIEAEKVVKNSKVLIMGMTFKENISDIRNSKVIDVYRELLDYGVIVDVHDAYACSEEVENEYGVKLLDKIIRNDYDAIILAVCHDEYLKNYDVDFYKNLASSKTPVFLDLKESYSRKDFEEKGFIYWSM